MVRHDRRVRARYALRFVGNAVNLSTPFGLLTAALGRARLSRGPRGLLFAVGYRLPFPVASAFTVGNVIITRRPSTNAFDRTPLLRHEERHSWQYLACLGLPLVPLYLLAAGWSLLRCGDYATHNVFERLAGLEDGGYTNPESKGL